MSWQNISEQLVAQLLAFLAFFAFPIVQYVILKVGSRHEGNPELWYLPRYGFRLVIRNKPRKRVLKDIRYAIRVIRLVPPCDGCDVATTNTMSVHHDERLFLFPGADFILMSFQLVSESGVTRLILTGDLGGEKSNYDLEEIDFIRCEYTTTIQNFFNFNVQVGKRVTLDRQELLNIYSELQRNSSSEMFFPLQSVRSVG